MRPLPHRWPSCAAAIVAVVLLAFAGVRSTVMQAQMAAAPALPMCGGAAMGGAANARRSHAPDASHKACPYCAISAHAPVCDAAPVLAPPVAAAWRASPPAGALGPRGPPAREPRARGPPASPLIA